MAKDLATVLQIGSAVRQSLTLHLSRIMDHRKVFSCFKLVLVCLLGHVVADCNVCQTNQAACINSTSFYLCFGDGTPHTDNIYSCLDGTVCTARTAICVQKNALWPASCGDTSKCGQCSAHRNHKFACLSRHTFRMCYGAAQPTGPIGICPAGNACDAESDVVCTVERAGQTFTCDVQDDLVSSSTASPTTTRPTEPSSMTAQQLCELKAYTGLYETRPRDIYCKRYISCYFNKAGQIKAVEYECSANSYFEAETQRCVYKAPANCTARP
ncbi:uncharacterized protein LOC111592761 [Drosophila hydei]|uniref:Uncharacterized protein LOC111592761 n=1 Tax=Drosophila hydei TaxID=7224 RepID=A0A6J1L7J3_DROHY|nr:uncharacterized protein LOC111592761 [Drosophila hydei]